MACTKDEGSEISSEVSEEGDKEWVTLEDAVGNKTDLLYFDTTPSLYAELGRIVLEEKGVNYKKVKINLLKQDQLKPDFARINPEMQVPALSDKGQIVNDSQNIILYVNNLPGPNLIPLMQKAKVDRVLDYLYFKDGQGAGRPDLGSFCWQTGFRSSFLPLRIMSKMAGLKAAEMAIGKLRDENPDLADVYQAKINRMAGKHQDIGWEELCNAVQASVDGLSEMAAAAKKSGTWLTGPEYSLGDACASVWVQWVRWQSEWEAVINIPEVLIEWHNKAIERPAFKAAMFPGDAEPFVLDHVRSTIYGKLSLGLLDPHYKRM
eukprot:TRINITY_DN77704_c0_g1_i1.p1 TRINITY_DN77704_c0_g1~~TRINITY_DN77704_c0_g1_i1.p1  ORF type:complete len:339 (-),score=64.48 TRINITY_DN77704_c0_g1_i1:75-1034(-)